ncbi:MAG: hypothetical protein PF450_14310 [Bacteroidales bacterium]|jgi:hypothetical protein|nr:hypothetical protein [Bacteroidales bacterium]
MSYVPIEVDLFEVTGMQFVLQRAMRRPKKQTKEFDPAADDRLARALVKSGDDHAKCMRGIIAYFTIKLQVGFMIEFETYRQGVECLSTTSAMHGELKGLKGVELAEQKQADLVDKVYYRDILMSYQALRHIYMARRNHKHPDWKIFCVDFIEKLPEFDVFIYPEIKGISNNESKTT